MWVAYAIGASVLWGITYVINEQIYKKISVPGSLAITTLVTSIVLLVVAYSSGSLKRDFIEIISSKRLILLVGAEIASLTLAELFIGYSITHKDATLAGLIEISYPVFIALFSYLLFKETQINTTTLVGAILIFLGVFVVFYFN